MGANPNHSLYPVAYVEVGDELVIGGEGCCCCCCCCLWWKDVDVGLCWAEDDGVVEGEMYWVSLFTAESDVCFIWCESEVGGEMWLGIVAVAGCGAVAGVKWLIRCAFCCA